MSVEPYQIYQSMMLEIKLRIRAIDDYLNNAKNQLAALDIEFCFLQVRKIVEQICFASILCDKARYKEFRELEGATDDEDHGNYEQDWNSRIILNKLKDISPHFMPIPLGQKHSANGEHHFERADVNSTHNKLIKFIVNVAPICTYQDLLVKITKYTYQNKGRSTKGPQKQYKRILSI